MTVMFEDPEAQEHIENRLRYELRFVARCWLRTNRFDAVPCYNEQVARIAGEAFAEAEEQLQDWEASRDMPKKPKLEIIN